jgi:hypothetical protein
LNSDISTEKIKKVAMKFDETIEQKDREKIPLFFTKDCEIELLGLKLFGEEGIERWINWLYRYISKIKLEPITIMVEGNTFFEEFLVDATLYNGVRLKSKQSEILVYKDYKIQSLRLYFDRLELSQSLYKNPITNLILKRIISKSIDGLNVK